jgi:hypothetical protein
LTLLANCGIMYAKNFRLVEEMEKNLFYLKKKMK